MNVRIQAATERDIPAILALVRKLAEYEKLSDMVVATEENFREALFGSRPVAEALVAFANDRPVGFALYFSNFSTFLGRPGIYLEDLFVEPEYRKRVIGTALLKRLAAIAVSRNCGRLEWSALEWNRLAIDFYEHLGATVLEEWRILRMTGEPLKRLAEGV